VADLTWIDVETGDSVAIEMSQDVFEASVAAQAVTNSRCGVTKRSRGFADGPGDGT
jgi:hypothetical protein